jgi:AraC family transcriptional regulator
MSARSAVHAPTVKSRIVSFGAVTVELVELVCRGQVCAELPRYDQTRLTIALEEVGGTAEPRLDPAVPYKHPHVRNQVALLPPGVPVWLYSRRIEYVRAITLAFDWAALRQLAGDEVRLPDAPQLQLCQRNESVLQLARLLAQTLDERAPPAPLAELYSSTLVNAILIGFARGLAGRDESERAGLNRRQLRGVLRLLEEDLARRVNMLELARSVGLSQSQFYKAFKRATGMPPYRWQLDARIRRAQDLLRRRNAEIAEVAAATGFADQSHFTRVFREHVGSTPKVWQRARTRSAQLRPASPGE